MSDILFQQSPRAFAMGLPRLKEFQTASLYVRNIIRCNGLVDSGLREGKLYTKQSYLALVKGLPPIRTATYIFDPRDFKLFNSVNWKETGIPWWAIESAWAFHATCVTLKLGIQIPF